jgi:putative transposase
VQKITPKRRDQIGVDLGINALATCSDGSVFPNLKAYCKAKRKLAHLQRSVCRKEKGSSNRNQANLNVVKLDRRIANIRQDAIHKLTTWLAKNHSQIKIEALNISGMLKNYRLASAIADCGFYELKRQLEYKFTWYGSTVIKVDRFYPSSQLCSRCDHRQKMPLSARIFKCSGCGIELDRDLSASIKLEDWHPDIHYPKTVSSTEFACGGAKKPSSSTTRDSVKQELDINFIPKQLSLFDE